MSKIKNLLNKATKDVATSVADPGCLSRIRLCSIPDPGTKLFPSKNLSILTPKNGFQALRNMIRVVHPGSRIRILTFYPSRIPNPGVKKAPDPGLGSATLVATWWLVR